MKSQENYSQKYMEKSISNFHNSGMEMLRSRTYKKAQYYFSQALIVSKSLNNFNENKGTLIMISLINLGIYHKTLANLNESLRYFQEALLLDKSYKPNINNMIAAHLHVSSIFSQLGNHESALRHAVKSLCLLKRHPSRSLEYCETMVLAYFNIGVEYEYLNEHKDSQECYIKGYSYAVAYLGKSHILTCQIKNQITEILKEKGESIYRLNLESITKETSATSESSRMRPLSMPRSRRSSSFARKIKSIDVEIHKKIENRAALTIQKMWKGYITRKNFMEYILQIRILCAANAAKAAIAKFEIEKQQLKELKTKKSLPDFKPSYNTSPFKALVSLRKLRAAMNY